ncbi:hypothetical protein TRSC58_04521 [Trypanosoma rangeli SC58]|uniref:Uncharacterized protein n=1 Tax=Trypanosoma rangeli SC58 TaxID=429131 RepID=A0A061J0X7_TRYRA|nr:hypothetical protein TRSC58_04521 [Trypanosoma rangeli SC58]
MCECVFCVLAFFLFLCFGFVFRLCACVFVDLCLDMHTRIEEYEHAPRLSVHVDTPGVSFFEAEGLGTGDLYCVEEMKREYKGSNFPPCSGRNSEFFSVGAPLLNRHNKVQNVADWDKLFQLERELQCLGEEVEAFFPALGQSSVFKKPLGSVEDTLELEESLHMLGSRLNSIAAECHALGKKQQFLSKETVQKATEYSIALTAYRGIVAAAESMAEMLTGVFNCRTFLHLEAGAMRRAEEVSVLLDDIEKSIDFLETGVDTLRELSETKLDVLKRGLDGLSE